MKNGNSEMRKREEWNERRGLGMERVGSKRQGRRGLREKKERGGRKKDE